jgi:hypothetical protein
MHGAWLFAERLLYADWIGTRSVMVVGSQVFSTTNIATANQKRLVIVGATGMVGGYALRYALDTPPSEP